MAINVVARRLDSIRDDILEELARREPVAMSSLTPTDRALLIAQLDLLAEALL